MILIPHTKIVCHNAGSLPVSWGQAGAFAALVNLEILETKLSGAASYLPRSHSRVLAYACLVAAFTTVLLYCLPPTSSSVGYNDQQRLVPVAAGVNAYKLNII